MLYGATREEVRRKLGVALGAAEAGTLADPRGITLGAFLDQWLEEVARPSVRVWTYHGYEVHVRKHIKPLLGRYPLEKVAPQDVQMLLNRKLREGLSPKSVRYIRGTLRTALNQAMRWGMVVRNSAALVDGPRVDHYEIRPFSVEEAVAAGLDAIARDDRTFDAKEFIIGAGKAYEMIVVAFAAGDRRTLKNLLSREVYDGFEAAIRDRESKGEKAETRFVSIDRADIIGAELRARTAQVTVRFVSQLISVTRDRNGNVIDGSPEKVTDVTDVWTFARDVTSRDPNWKLVATEAGH